MKYLGVNIPKDFSNLGKLNQRLKEDLKRLNLIPILSFESRIESVKMNILPRILNLFQTLPIEINDKLFHERDKLISQYIWQGKKPRIRFQTLHLPKNKGGLAVDGSKLKKIYQERYRFKQDLDFNHLNGRTM